MNPLMLISMIVPLLLCGIFAVATASSDDIGRTYHLYHKLGNKHASKISSRGTIKIAPSEDDSDYLVASFHPDASAQLDISAFDSMVENNDLYTVIITQEGDKPPSETNKQYVSASVPGCSLRRSNLREEIGLSINPTGKLLSVSYRPIISPLAPKTCTQLPPLSDRPAVIFGRGEASLIDENSISSSNDDAIMPFKTTVSFDSHTPMMAIPTVLPQQRPPPGLKWYRRNAKNNPNPLLGSTGEGGIPGIPEEQPSSFKSSFLYRYWYIILPVMIMTLFGGQEEEEGKAGAGVQQAGGPGQQQSGNAGAAATEALAGGATHGMARRHRRGKRD